MKSKKMTDEELQSLVGNAVTTATEHNRETVVDDRLKAQRYFEGKVDIGHEEGRSKVVATKCRDVVRQVKPSLLRVFLSTDKPVEFIPRGQEDVQAAEQATKYVQWKFNQQNGYRVLSDVFHDALVKKVGIAKVWYEDADQTELLELNGLDELEYIMLAEGPDVEIVEHSEEDGLHDVKLSVVKADGDIRIQSIPPEDFFIDDGATSIDDFDVCGHQTELPIADLMAMGIAYDQLEDLSSDEDDEESQERLGYAEDDDTAIDPMMRKVKVTEAYMRVDVEGTGKPLLYCFLLGGDQGRILRKDVVDETPFAVFEVDPEPHAFYGRSLVDILIEDQDAATSMLRGVIDNVHLANNPSVDVIEGQANMDDVLNNEYGAVRRVKQPGAIQTNIIPFVAGSTIPFLQYYDGVVESKTGVSRASLGLDPDALQNASATAVNAAVNGGNAQAEVMARNLAEGGVKRLFKLMLKLTIKHMPEEAMMRLNGQFVPVRPDGWDPTMDMSVNVGLGTGQEDMKMAALQMTFQTQQGIWQAYGPQNGLVTMTGMRNTLADMLAIAGLKNADRYYNPMDPQAEQKLMAQAQAAQGQEQADPNAAIAQAEIQKAQITAQAKLQSDQQRHQNELQKMAMDARHKQAELAVKDDRERDKMLQDGVMEAADLVGKYGVGPDLVRLYQQQQNN